MPGGSHSSIRHRGGDRLHTVGAAVAAVLAVLAGILLVNLLNGPSDPDSDNGAREAPSAPVVPVPATTEPDELPSTSPASTRPAAPSPSTSPKPSPSPRSAPADPPPDDPPPDDAGRAPRVFAPVVVLNNSRIGGLADTAADRVEEAGFPVERVGNYVSQYNVPVTTVFYDPEDAEAARTLLETVPGIERMVPREETRIIETDTLILVVTRDFPTGDQP